MLLVTSPAINQQPTMGIVMIFDITLVIIVTKMGNCQCVQEAEGRDENILIPITTAG